MRVVMCILVVMSSSLTAGAELPEEFIVMAHRGVVTEDITENSLPALEAAVTRGYTHIEVDIRATKDGHAVCLHDNSLERTTGIGKFIHEITLAELRELVDEETVPSFDTFCQRAQGRIDLQPDMKKVPRNLQDAYMESIISSMKKHNLLDNAYCIGSPDNKEDMRGHAKISMRPVENPEETLKHVENPGETYYIFGHAEDFNAGNVKRYQDMGLDVIVSINTFHYDESEALTQGLADIKRMITLGVDGVQIDSVYDKAVFGQP